MDPADLNKLDALFHALLGIPADKAEASAIKLSVGNEQLARRALDLAASSNGEARKRIREGR